MPASLGRVLLAYSGGLDTSCILAWLIEQGYEVYTLMADVGQEEDFAAAEKKAFKVGAKTVFLEDLKREFITELIYPAVQANCIYENVYLLGTSLAHPVIVRGMIAVADREGCNYVSHGCTGKINDRVRFELAFYGLKPDIKVTVPWCLPAGQNSTTVSVSTPWSTDENLFHISYEAGILEDPNDAPETPERISIEFAAGLPTKVTAADKTYTDPVEIFLPLNALGRAHGIGRIDIVENRFIGTPGASILRAAHVDLEGLTLDRNVRALRDHFVTIEFSRMLYFFTPEREIIVSAIPASQRTVNGLVRLKLYKGNIVVDGRESSEGLYDERQSSMDEMGGFEPTNTTDFTQIEPIRIKKWAQANIHRGQSGVAPRDV
ncbi:argininosuccinate synthetase [Mycena rosella]|uniref:argininosuccinate synthase n=1 Tax=Mycena rosella TaxID=1033263 RepID=A0AAD7D9L1_MYCRO|nr:argininosuccinate synthetase [Mycena rosella]